MRQRSYNSEITSCTAQVIDVFNNITIERTNDNGSKFLVMVPCVYATRSRMLKNEENREKLQIVPITAIAIKGFIRSTARVHSVNDEILFDNGQGNYNILYKTPVPIDIKYELTMLTKSQEDMDQIMCNFISIMNPDVYIVWPHPKGGCNIKTKLVWDGTVTVNYVEELASSRPYTVTATAQFTLKTWVFPGICEGFSPLSGDGMLSGRIHSINTHVAMVSGMQEWYDVPYSQTFNQYLSSIQAGYIKYPHFDVLPLSGTITSGYCPVPPDNPII